MPSPARSARRAAITEWTIALGVGVAGAAFQHRPTSLADAPACPGLLELATVIASRTAPDAVIASVVSSMNIGLAVVALAVVVRVFQQSTQSAPVAAAVGLAVATTPVLAPILAPSPAACVAVAALSFLLATRAISAEKYRGLSAGGACAGLSLGAAFSPPLTLPFAALAGWIAWKASRQRAARVRVAAAALAIVGVALWQIVLSLALPPMPTAAAMMAGESCAMPRVSAVSLAAIGTGLRDAVDGIGPFTFGLAALGAFVARAELHGPGAWTAIAIAASPVVSVAWSGPAPLRTLAPTLVGFWWLVAIGLREIVVHLRGNTGRRLIAVAIIVALPLLQFSRRTTPDVTDPDRPRGHDRVTRQDLSRHVRPLPSNAAIVAEDALVDLTVSDIARRLQRAGKALRAVARDGEEVANLGPTSRVFAFPRGQLELQHQGFQLDALEGPAGPGLAEVRRTGRCESVGGSWTDFPELGKSARLAFVAGNAHARGPIVVYLSAPARLEPRPVEWPSRVTRGYFARQYDRERDEDRRVLEADARAESAPADHGLFQDRFVARLELWRIPEAPLILPVAVDGTPKAAIARALTVEHGTVRLCPSFADQVSELLPVRRGR